MTNKPTWEREFGVLFISKENGKGEPKVYCHPDDIKNFISTKLAEQKKELIEIIKTPMSTEFEDPEEESADYSIEDFRTRLLNLIKQD